MARKKGDMPLCVSEKTKIKKAIASGKTINRTADELKRSHSTVKTYASQPDVKREVKVIRERLATGFEDLAAEILSKVTVADIEAANLMQKMTSAAIATDKANMLRQVVDRLAGFGGNYLASVCIAIDAQQRGEQGKIIEIEGGDEAL